MPKRKRTASERMLTLSKERTILSKERTILSFMQTGLAFIGISLVILNILKEPFYQGIAYALLVIGFIEIIESLRRLVRYKKKMQKLSGRI